MRRALLALLVVAALVFGGLSWWRAEDWKARHEAIKGAPAEVLRLTSERDAARKQVSSLLTEREQARKSTAFANRGLVGCVAANEDLSANLRSCRAGVRFN